MIRLTMLSVAVLILAACTATPIPPSAQVAFGPTTKSKDSTGYVLRNRKLAVKIDEQTAAAILWPEYPMNTLVRPDRVVPSFSSQSDSSPIHGYVESRDEETWQYFGQSADGIIGWRIVYNLYLDSLNVSYIVQNNSKEPITGHVVLPSVEHVAVQPFNENSSLNAPVADGSIRSDEHTLKPGERISFTTRWTLR